MELSPVTWQVTKPIATFNFTFLPRSSHTSPQNRYKSQSMHLYTQVLIIAILYVPVLINLHLKDCNWSKMLLLACWLLPKGVIILPLSWPLCIGSQLNLGFILRSCYLLLNLRSADKLLLVELNISKTTRGARAFVAAAPTLWNSLPFLIRSAQSINVFKSCLKLTYFIWLLVLSELTSFCLCVFCVLVETYTLLLSLSSFALALYSTLVNFGCFKCAL